MSPADVDGYPDDTAPDSEIEILLQIIQDLSTEGEYEHQPMSVSLVDIARPAKAKGTHTTQTPKTKEIVFISTS